MFLILVRKFTILTESDKFLHDHLNYIVPVDATILNNNSHNNSHFPCCPSNMSIFFYIIEINVKLMCRYVMTHGELKRESCNNNNLISSNF